MFLLIENNKTFYLIKEGKYIVGRHVGDIIIKNHSVSRKHAEIIVENNEAFVRDCESKFFTTYNGKILLKNEKTKLEDGGEIIFGEVKVSFKVGENLVTCSTGVKEHEDELRLIIKEIGGEYLKDWNDTCTYLTTSEIMVTLKVLHAIMDNKKIVTPNFWKAFLKNMKENKLPPDPSEFYPPLGESMIHTKFLDYNPDRKCIFVGKTFAFWKKKRFSSMHAIISKAGGTCLLIPAEKNKSQKELLELMDNCIVMDPEDQSLEKTYSVIIEAYKKKGKRIIPVQEIVLAILQCSCEENCNPFFDRAKTVFIRESQKPGPSKVVVGETECFEFESEKEQKPVIIPSSFDMESYLNTQTKNDKTKYENLSQANDDMTKKTEVSGIVQIDLVEDDVSSKKKLAPIFKRPAEETFAPPPKKIKEGHASMKLNPFSAMKSKLNERESTSKLEVDLDLTNNPFGQIQFKKDIKKENESDDVIIVNDSGNDNPKKRKGDDCVDSVVSKKRTKIICKKNRKFVEVAPIDFSELNHSVSNGVWVDKTFKEEIKPTPLNLGEEEQKWCERFNNSVVIVSKDLWRKDKENITDLTLAPSSSNVKNFKKFRKVTVPKSGQIIKCSKIVFGNSNLGVDYKYSDDEDNRNM
ncbi:nibrin [Coccinella septempunctata]|uniref:nibrin n=1 Tax=Coccinella septempunctata TaxID=41139 RepID=UPI001D08564B|nr:nibrin [Coccinella septempunctata]